VLSEKKKNDLLAFVWLALAGLLFLCLISFDPNDISFHSSSPNRPYQNFVGFAGAYISWALMITIGKGSFFLVLLMCFWALAQWSGRKRQILWLKLFAGALFFISACTSLSLITGPVSTAKFKAGGLIGYFSATLLEKVFGRAAIIVSCVVFVIALLLATEFMLYPLVMALAKAVRGAWQGFLRRLRRSGTADRRKDAEKREGPKTLSIKIKRPEMKAPEPKSEPRREDVPRPLIKSFLNRKAEEVKPAKKAASAQSSKPRQQWGNYKLPQVDLLKDAKTTMPAGDMDKMIQEQSRILQDTLADFGIDAKVVEVEQGPVITRYELQPASGIKLQRITGLQDNIALAMKATSVRILAPIPGKARIGIEIPNPKKQLVGLKEVLLSEKLQAMTSKLGFCIGKDSAGEPMVGDLDAMPHLLIAGSTGSGKTVCINAVITSLLYRVTPQEVRFIMIDPKMVELIGYNGIPHLLTPVITQIDRVPSVLNWLINEMENRYKTLSKSGVRHVEGYNEKVALMAKTADVNGKKSGENGGEIPQPLPYIVMIIDELADLMLTQGKEVEHAITRLSQLARAVGIHMVLATQRPSVDVITGVIKANFQARIAFQVASKVDSRTVLDQNGADCLLGQGDLLYMDPSKPHLVRGQGAWVTDEEIQNTVDACKSQQESQYDEEILQSQAKSSQKGADFRDDEHYEEACRIILGTALGERVMRPDFGCAVHDLTFDPNDATLVGKVEFYVRNALERWEPRLQVRRVEATPEEKRMVADVEYLVRQTNRVDNVVFPFFEGALP